MTENRMKLCTVVSNCFIHCTHLSFWL